MELKLPMQNNFSRPFCCSSSSQGSSIPKVSPSLGPGIGITSGTSQPLESTLHGSSTIIPSRDCASIQLKSSPPTRYPESPTPYRDSLLKWEARGQFRPSPVRPASDARDAKAVQFRSIRGRMDPSSITNENLKNLRAVRNFDGVDRYSELQGIHSTISSKRLVEIFLNSRHYQKEDAEDNETDPVFL
jgi:hypothetical protein